MLASSRDTPAGHHVLLVCLVARAVRVQRLPVRTRREHGGGRALFNFIIIMYKK